MTTTPENVSCGFVPFPGSGSYGHWTCGRNRFHLGRHRFANYTVPRIPRVWHARQLWGSFQADRRLRKLNGTPGYSYRSALFPTKYEPV